MDEPEEVTSPVFLCPDFQMMQNLEPREEKKLLFLLHEVMHNEALRLSTAQVGEMKRCISHNTAAKCLVYWRQIMPRSAKSWTVPSVVLSELLGYLGISMPASSARKIICAHLSLPPDEIDSIDMPVGNQQSLLCPIWAIPVVVCAFYFHIEKVTEAESYLDLIPRIRVQVVDYIAKRKIPVDVVSKTMELYDEAFYAEMRSLLCACFYNMYRHKSTDVRLSDNELSVKRLEKKVTDFIAQMKASRTCENVETGMNDDFIIGKVRNIESPYKKSKKRKKTEN